MAIDRLKKEDAKKAKDRGDPLNNWRDTKKKKWDEVKKKYN